MIYTKKILLFIICVCCWSCEREIKVKLNDSSSRVVIEAQISNLAVTQKIFISNTISINTSNINKKDVYITGASVIVSDDENNSYIFSENPDQAGAYEADFRGIEGRTYYLKIIIDGKTYTATNKMPKPVFLKSVKFIASTLNLNQDTIIYTARPEYDDKLYTQTKFCFVQYINYKKDDELYVRKNVSNLGMQPLFDGPIIRLGDKYKLETWAVNDDVYDYYYDISKILRSEGQVTPYNPRTNIVGGALGCFNVCAVTVSEFVITKDIIY